MSFGRTPPWLYLCMSWILFGDIVPFEASLIKCVSMVPSNNIKTMAYCRVKVFTCTFKTLKHKHTFQNMPKVFLQPPQLPHLATLPLASLMKRTGNLNRILCTFETTFYDSLICLVIWKQVSGFIVCFCLLQTDCLTFRLTSAQISPGELGRLKFLGRFESFIHSWSLCAPSMSGLKHSQL